MTTPYTTAKTALIRATACLQAEMNSDKKDIQLYSLHPGGPKTKMNEYLIDDDVDAAIPGFKDSVMNFVNSQKDTVDLCAYTCVFLAADARAKGIRGRYLDVEQDIVAVCDAADEIVDKNLLDLKVGHCQSKKRLLMNVTIPLARDARRMGAIPASSQTLAMDLYCPIDCVKELHLCSRASFRVNYRFVLQIWVYIASQTIKKVNDRKKLSNRFRFWLGSQVFVLRCCTGGGILKKLF